MYYNFNQYINLGATLEKNGCNFAIYLKEIKTLSLNIFYSNLVILVDQISFTLNQTL